MAIWLARMEYRPSRASNVMEMFQRGFFGLLLAVQCVGCAIAIWSEFIIPFSGAKAAAEMIQANAPADVPLIGDPDFSVSSVSGYLQRPIYIAARREYSTFIKQDQIRSLSPMPTPQLVERVREFLNQQKRDVVLILSQPVGGDFPLDNDLLGMTPRSLTDEQFIVGVVHYHPPTTPPTTADSTAK
jgi:hypothetical protein